MCRQWQFVTIAH
uniref:Uncharacterized protein n=1 Tax=Candidatus Kentrum sp. LFY TaxID=2126342 RepID=A0A450V7F5_9GAMM|nr:MAG: hypothetical protein BECKLFY1418A_GA0070994_11236 [Candidatus Kentron sp. LFY]